MKNETIIEVNGKIYTLQHPGNREWLKLKQEIIQVHANKTVGVDIVKMLDYCFEHVVFPAEGPKLNLDIVDINEIEEVWSPVLQQFFKGQSLLESYTSSQGSAGEQESSKPK
jgi:hypothetical protein